MNGRVLIIAGSDSGGGAGIQADIKTVTALGGFAMTAISALTAQNTTGVNAIHEIPSTFIIEQMQAVVSDLGTDAVKTGMLHSTGVIKAVSEALATIDSPIVVDPVMIAKGGATLLLNEAIVTMKSQMIPLAHVLTPNIPEAEILSGMKIDDHNSVKKAAKVLCDLGPRAVLMKGGHMRSKADIDTVTDFLFEGGELIEAFTSPRLDTPNTHGTGCTLASAIATGLSQNLGIRDSVEKARNFVFEAIKTAPGYGKGYGPLNHGHTLS